MSSPRLVPIGVLALTAAVPAFVLAGVWQYAEANVSPATPTTTTVVPAEPTGVLTTPLLSFRRQADALAERAAAREAAEIYATQVSSLTEQLSGTACLRMLDGETVVADVDSAVPLVPASNQKVLVAAVGLDVIGPDFRYRTELQSLPPIDGVVPGDVSLIGGGDPVLTTAGVTDPQRYPAFNTTSLDALADQLVRLGITSIQGDVVGDGSRYDDEFRVPTWGDGITNLDGGPYDALLVDDGLIENGNYGRVPARSAAVVFTELLRQRGIEVVGGAANEDRVTDPSFTTLALVESEPFSEVLVELLHTSDNNTAEMIVKEIGYQARGEGTRAAGLDVIRSRLAEWGVPIDGLQLDDGSGLSRANRVSCATLAAVLTGSPVADELVGLLPVAGRDGTLADQLLGTPAEGRLRAKTGTLTDVKALTGSQPAADGDPVTFSVVLNGTDADEPAVHLPVWNEIVALIDEYPVVVEPDPSRFEPR
jgi:D-alanyl-D-alanine carboxypeptidase/D-alanyl-D-alanine-endopeptidase (penicillin-binding protein 4)